MNKSSTYYQQVSLLIDCIPHIAKEKGFALKGGTAINLFMNNFPRLSVDIDLTYLPLEPRDNALMNVRAALTRIGETLNVNPDVTATLQENKQDEMRIIVNSKNQLSKEAQIKIEVSPVSRGTLHDAIVCDVTDSVEEEFGFASVQVVSIPDLYGGKLCAALDRQHPRDFFDVLTLLKNRGIDRDIFVGFLAYLLSHNRPLSEVMSPRWKDIASPFHNEFKGMTFDEITLAELEAVPEAMLRSMKSHLTKADSDFLYSFKTGEPDWNMAPHAQFQCLPAIKWKLLNIQKMSPPKRKSALDKLETVLQTWLAL